MTEKLHDRKQPEGWRRFLSRQPGKRATELYWLYYTPVWGIAAGLVMITGLGETWGDLELMTFGVALALGAVAGPIFRVPEGEKGLPWYQRSGVKLTLTVVGLSFGYNYMQTPFFYDVLHMHYGFDVDIVIENNPVFLYFMTVAYFATYCVLTCMTWRWLRWALRDGFVRRWLPWVAAPVVMAFLETVLNANPFMTELFCYDDMTMMLWFGTLSYAIAFVVALPMWIGIDEEPGEFVPAHRVVVWLLAALAADHLILEVLRHNVAPLVTVVEPGANGMDPAGSCLE